MKKLKAGIVGFGRIGQFGHYTEMNEYPDRFEVAAVADILPERLEDARKKNPAIQTCSSLEEMLANSDLDIITIATRHPDHVPMALKIMEAGKIAVVEKPVATSLQEMDELLAAGKAHPGKLYFRHNRRFEAPFIKVRQLIRDDVIGSVQYIKLYRSVGFCRRNDWMTMTEFYGGLLTNWGPHLIDQALQFLEAPVADLWADVRSVVSIGDGDDLFKILLKAENGRLADIEVSGSNTMPGRQMEITGNRGTIVYNGGKEIEVRRIDPSVELKPLKPHPETPGLFYGNHDEKLYFVEEKYQVPEIPFSTLWVKIHESVTEGKEFPITPAEAREVVRVTEEAFRKSGFKPILNYKRS